MAFEKTMDKIVALCKNRGLLLELLLVRGKEIRLERIMNRNTKKTVIIPMDHGVTNGPIAGLIDMGQAVNLVAEGGANAVISPGVRTRRHRTPATRHVSAARAGTPASRPRCRPR